MSIEYVSLGMTHAGDTGGVCVYIHSLLHRLGFFTGNHLSVVFCGYPLGHYKHPFVGRGIVGATFGRGIICDHLPCLFPQNAIRVYIAYWGSKDTGTYSMPPDKKSSGNE